MQITAVQACLSEGLNISNKWPDFKKPQHPCRNQIEAFQTKWNKTHSGTHKSNRSLGQPVTEKELSPKNLSLHGAAKSFQNTSFIAVDPYLGMTKSPLDAFSYLYDIDETSGFSDCKSVTAIYSVFLLSECLLDILWFCLTHTSCCRWGQGEFVVTGGHKDCTYRRCTQNTVEHPYGKAASQWIKEVKARFKSNKICAGQYFSALHYCWEDVCEIHLTVFKSAT